MTTVELRNELLRKIKGLQLEIERLEGVLRTMPKDTYRGPFGRLTLSELARKERNLSTLSGHYTQIAEICDAQQLRHLRAKAAQRVEDLRAEAPWLSDRKFNRATEAYETAADDASDLIRDVEMTSKSLTDTRGDNQSTVDRIDRMREEMLESSAAEAFLPHLPHAPTAPMPALPEPQARPSKGGKPPPPSAVPSHPALFQF